VAKVVTDIDRYRSDAGLSIRRLAELADVSFGYLSQVLTGTREPSVAFLTAIASALGADLSIRLFPNTGPRVRDPIQSRIVEACLRIAAPAWRRWVEVGVVRPSRGTIDLVFDDAARAAILSTEVESRIDRVEQQVRWAADKAASLPSAEMWRTLDGQRTIGRLLIVRSTVPSREIARRFESTLATAYPARASDVFDALTTSTMPWPGHGILWADVRGDEAQILARPPRGVALGR
jgi:transcriptional regulator with XRE-family HTH domain